MRSAGKSGTVKSSGLVLAAPVLLQVGNARCVQHQPQVPIGFQRPELGAPQVTQLVADRVNECEVQNFADGGLGAVDATSVKLLPQQLFQVRRAEIHGFSGVKICAFELFFAYGLLAFSNGQHKTRLI